ncbi:EAL domain-containing protein (putative c-di-GMP-specific phosphodiesterase class I) [Yokenella regensburgei]|nr:EAL domain-containing protein (putative c-di-GMP-specific phosphodiesterase class I) [Yokenella regensburgei]
MTMMATKSTGMRYVFQPMFDREGRLIAVECLSRLDPLKYGHSTEVEHFFAHASEALRTDILLEQIALVARYQSWFCDNNVMVTLNIDEQTLMTLDNEFISERVNAIGCLHFEVNEFSRTLTRHHPTSRALSEKYSFWLDDFGAGFAGFSALAVQPFRFIKTDKCLLWSLLEKNNGQELMSSLLRYFSANHHLVIVEGVETEAHRQWLADMPWFALQGMLWQESSIEALVASTPPLVPLPLVSGQ